MNQAQILAGQTDQRQAQCRGVLSEEAPVVETAVVMALVAALDCS